MSKPRREPAPPALAAGVFAALGDRTRLRLIARLSEGGARSIADLSTDGPLTRQAVTKHLQVLETAGLVASERVGRQSLYSYRAKPVADAAAFLDAMSEQWDGRLAKLKALIEADD